MPARVPENIPGGAGCVGGFGDSAGLKTVRILLVSHRGVKVGMSGRFRVSNASGGLPHVARPTIRLRGKLGLPVRRALCEVMPAEADHPASGEVRIVVALS